MKLLVSESYTATIRRVGGGGGGGGGARFFCLLVFPAFLPSAIFCTKVRAGTTRFISKKLRDGPDIQCHYDENGIFSIKVIPQYCIAHPYCA